MMIPVCNRLSYLRQALESVLAQDPGPYKMQICIVDNSTEIINWNSWFTGKEAIRVEVLKQPRHVIMSENWNTCIIQARGHLVHILNDDDYILPGFYAEFEKAAAAYPQVAGFFSRCLVVNESGELQWLTDRITHLEKPSNSPSGLLYGNQIYTPGAVVRRSFYETNGGFLPSLTFVVDWEMWLRCITLGSGLFINKPLACYRFSAGNGTARAGKTAENIKDSLRLGEILSARVPGFDRQRFVRVFADMALEQKKVFEAGENPEAAQANYALWKELVPPTSLSARMGLIFRAVTFFLRKLKSALFQR